MENNKSSFRWFVLVLAALNLGIAMIAKGSVPPLFSEIQEQIPLTKAQMGTTMGITNLASLLLAVFGGAFADRFGARLIFGLAALIIAVSGACRGFTGNAYEFISLMFIMGIGAAVIGPSLIKAVSTWFPKNQLAMANGICFASMGIGGALAMGTAANYLSPACGGWRGLMFTVGGLSVVMAILWLLMYRDKAKTPVKTEAKKDLNMKENFKKVLRVKDIWLLSMFFALYNAAIISVTSFMPIIFEERGFSRAGESVAVILGTAVFFNIIGGTLSDKIGKRKIFLACCSIIFGLCVISFGVLDGVLLLIPLVIAGAAFGTVAPVLMAVPVELEEIGQPLSGTAIGLIFMLGNTGGFIGPVLAGKIMDVTGMYWAGLIFMCAAFVVAAGLVMPLRETGKRMRR